MNIERRLQSVEQAADAIARRGGRTVEELIEVELLELADRAGLGIRDLARERLTATPARAAEIDAEVERRLILVVEMAHQGPTKP